MTGYDTGPPHTGAVIPHCSSRLLLIPGSLFLALHRAPSCSSQAASNDLGVPPSTMAAALSFTTPAIHGAAKARAGAAALPLAPRRRAARPAMDLQPRAIASPALPFLESPVSDQGGGGDGGTAAACAGGVAKSACGGTAPPRPPTPRRFATVPQRRVAPVPQQPRSPHLPWPGRQPPSLSPPVP